MKQVKNLFLGITTYIWVEQSSYENEIEIKFKKVKRKNDVVVVFGLKKLKKVSNVRSHFSMCTEMHR